MSVKTFRGNLVDFNRAGIATIADILAPNFRESHYFNMVPAYPPTFLRNAPPRRLIGGIFVGPSVDTPEQMLLRKVSF